MSDSKTKRAPSTETFLPLSRVRTIMKSSLDTGLITNEVLFMVTKCTELFVQHLAREAYKSYCSPSKQSAGGGSSSGDTLKYEHLSRLVNKSKNLEFLLQIVPDKIRVHEFQEMLRLNRNAVSGDEDEDDDDDDDDDEDDGDSGSSSDAAE
ncbi:chromatin accessibility complex 16kD protein [Drosophila tropicalis]|uniref:chromatin accessibility complex 16kD protein n=1 Tax=Drosophila tropicalis TaxID=46794 RepID=UPI0035ABAF36